MPTASEFSPSGTAGWEQDDPGLDFGLTVADLDLLLVPEFEVEGCYLLEDAVATALVGDCSNYESERGGAGPRAWSNHWLLVPLIERDGARSGFIWADDPSDSMLPSRERLQALRTFANQATMALRAARDFETLNARNSELDALHTTTVGLLERLDLDSVLTRIMHNACSLVGTPDGYLALVDESGEALRTAVKLGLLEDVGPALLRRGEGVAGRVWESGQSLSIDDYSAWSGIAPGFTPGDFYATVGVPLRAAGEVVGVIGLAYREPGRTFDPAQVALIERFAQLASLALENARLYTALQQSEELHRQIVDCSTDLISVVDLDGTIVVMSPSAFETLGIEPQKMVGTYFAGLVHADDLAGAQEMFGKALQGTLATTTVRVQHADGSWVLLDAIASVIVGPDGSHSTSSQPAAT